jgi:hypothetical protein
VTSTAPDLLARVQADPVRYGGKRTVLTKPFDLDALLAAVLPLTGPA